MDIAAFVVSIVSALGAVSAVCTHAGRTASTIRAPG
jgi:hypothetical protein